MMIDPVILSFYGDLSFWIIRWFDMNFYLIIIPTQCFFRFFGDIDW